MMTHSKKSITKIDGLEVYRIYISLKIHLESKDYYYRDRPIQVSWEKYQSHRNINIFNWLAFQYDEDFIYEYILSNMIINPNIQPSMLKNKNGIKIHKKWQTILEDIDTIFNTELIKMYEMFKFETIDDMFELIKKCVSVKNSSDIVNINSIDEMLEDEIVLRDTSDSLSGDMFDYLSTVADIHFVIILDKVMKKCMNFSFLENFILANPDLKTHQLIRTVKYKSLLPVEEYLHKKRIKDFIKFAFGGN